MEQERNQGLYDESFEHDNCGIGAIVSIKGIKTHKTVSDALSIVENLEHRAGKDASGETGDGVGILLQISHDFFKGAAADIGIELGEEGDYGVGMFFFPKDEKARIRAKKRFEVTVKKEGLKFLGWRYVPRKPEILGELALKGMPYIEQAFIERPKDVEKGLDFDRRLYVVRRIFEHTSKDDTYVASLSSRTIVYKGMFLVGQLRDFFPDLQDERYKTAVAMVHSRFSTNTNPSWQRAHPNRYIVHNGEINTIKGNADKMIAREENMYSKVLEDKMAEITPVVNVKGSDSAMLDNTLEFLLMNGMPLPLAVMITIPEPWCNNEAMPRDKRDFYEYYATMMEPWDGPASILFSDGDMMGAVLDRNGLRPSRYYVTKDDYLVLASEVGVLPVEESNIKLKSRLQPGKMLLVDMKEGKLVDDDELKHEYAGRHPYGEWLDAELLNLKDVKIPNARVPRHKGKELTRIQTAFGYTFEDVKETILPMAANGSESIGAMGVDTPLATLSSQHRPLFDYFKQQFAQVTNPPIDCIREEIVTSTTLFLGSGGDILEEKQENCNMLRINNPILTNTDLLKIKNLKADGIKAATVPITYYKNTSLEKALSELFIETDRVYAEEGANIIILTDRGVDENHVAIPSLLAVSALQQHLVRTRKRTKLSLILDSGEPRAVHHFATLIGFGVSAVNPYLAHESIGELIDEGLLNKDYYAAVEDYNHAIISGIVKTAAKMGISTVQSYMGAKIFEAIGIDKEVVDKYFTGCVCRIGGQSLLDLENSVEAQHDRAFDPLGLKTDDTLDAKGFHKMRSGGEKHLYNPESIHMLQKATQTGDFELFQKFCGMVNNKDKVMNLRGLFDLKYQDKEIPLEEVESVDSIVRRFKTGAMSYGSISKEAHETMAIAMNMLHGKSNSGEGGEDDDRIESKGSELNRCSAIKQVASGRFGVTSKYLVSADEIQIKMAQGAKPGEGGHLPGSKVYPWIAKTRRSTPGVSLISPPPHHDIYSIEDLAELIYDLKNANKNARISVKLVSEAGVGTVASGVAKGGAQVILISGYDGGTGAAPVSSIHNAGMPWEVGLAETHQTLIKNGLRNKVIIETDGKLLTGRDVAIACMLGAEEFGFATAPLVTMGCIMMRVCNKDTCPVGVATQNPELRKRFKGKPEYVVNFMRFIAEDLRHHMAKLGVRSVDELVGRSDLLATDKELMKKHHINMDLEQILYPGVDHEAQMAELHIDYNHKDVYDFKLESTVDETELAELIAGADANGGTMEIDIKNTDRSLGTLLGAEITRRMGEDAKEDSYRILCHGSGGQSFGAFIPQGLTIMVEGDSNDYFGKGLSGGKLAIYPSKDATYKEDENIIIGNVALYGATSGSAYINGIAGERFAVRNSGAVAVVEGCGDHGCEYMTGGRVAVLGDVGKNFAAGMSGGIAYVLDEKQELYKKTNKSMISMEQVTESEDADELRDMISKHVELTDSEKGKAILENFDEYLPKFKKIIPHDYKKITTAIARFTEKGLSREKAEVEAFEEMMAGRKA